MCDVAYNQPMPKARLDCNELCKATRLACAVRALGEACFVPNAQSTNEPRTNRVFIEKNRAGMKHASMCIRHVAGKSGTIRSSALRIVLAFVSLLRVRNTRLHAFQSPCRLSLSWLPRLSTSSSELFGTALVRRLCEQ